MLKRFKVNSKIYNSIIEKSKAAFHFTEGYDIDVSGSSARIYYDNGFMSLKETTILNHITDHPEKDCLIIEAAMYTYYTGEKIIGLNYWQQFILMDGGNDMEDIIVTPWPRQANMYVHKILKKEYADEEVEEILNSHVVKEEEKVKPLHSILTNNESFDYDTIYEISNVVYYDINKAHRDALIEMFPKCEKYFRDKKTMDRWGKDCINIYVGDLCNHDHRETYNWIVKRTRNILTAAIRKVNGTVIYANTDGVMIWNPSTLIETSNKVGAFSNEMKGDKVYFYYHLKEDGIPQYYIYQYIDKHGKMVIKGTLKKEYRDKIDLSKQKKVWSNKKVKRICI